MKFTANVDKKFEVWQNLTIQFEADDENEAQALLQKWDGVPPESEYLFVATLSDTEQPLSVSENNGQPVYELHDLVQDNS